MGGEAGKEMTVRVVWIEESGCGLAAAATAAEISPEAMGPKSTSEDSDVAWCCHRLAAPLA